MEMGFEKGFLEQFFVRAKTTAPCPPSGVRPSLRCRLVPLAATAFSGGGGGSLSGGSDIKPVEDIKLNQKTPFPLPLSQTAFAPPLAACSPLSDGVRTSLWQLAPLPLHNLTSLETTEPSRFMFDTGNIPYTDLQTIYGLVQCCTNTRDNSVSDCNQCLISTVSLIQPNCNNSNYCDIATGSCRVVYASLRFYGTTTALNPSLPSNGAANTTSSRGGYRAGPGRPGPLTVGPGRAGPGRAGPE
ncbi:hypothetical protein EJ110_NYTH57826 [Nymphaea thermarum]|nr:hypothetical protein EJ110_NYTH57826 [Nymphaea thermarum]